MEALRAQSKEILIIPIYWGLCVSAVKLFQCLRSLWRAEREKRMRRKKVCFIGYGSTEYSRKSEAPVLWYYAEAIRNALKQTGLHKKEIQGLSITTQVSPDYSPHVAEQLGLEVDWVLNGDYGGAGGVMSVRRAADAIEAGHVELIVLVGANSFDRSTPQQRLLEYQRANYVDVYGYGGPNTLMALIQRLHMAQYGTTLEQIGKIAMAQRENALNNPQALFRAPMSYQDYFNSRMISDPIRLFDCVMPCSGAECVILASEEKAKDHGQTGLSCHRRRKVSFSGRQHAAGQNDFRYESRRRADLQRS